jgi:hypothetical protein
MSRSRIEMICSSATVIVRKARKMCSLFCVLRKEVRRKKMFLLTCYLDQAGVRNTVYSIVYKLKILITCISDVNTVIHQNIMTTITTIHLVLSGRLDVRNEVLLGPQTAYTKALSFPHVNRTIRNSSVTTDFHL